MFAENFTRTLKNKSYKSVIQKLDKLDDIAYKFNNAYHSTIGLRKFLQLKKIKILCRVQMWLVILMVKKVLERFTKKTCKQQIKKLLREKAINYMWNGKVMVIHLIGVC